MEYPKCPNGKMTAEIRLPWRPVHLHASWGYDDDPVLWIDVARFERTWRLSHQWLGPAGVPGGLGDRYARAGAWLVSANPIDMCQVWINEIGMGFTDGRHRFAWLRDHGVDSIPVQLSPESLAFGVAAIETDRRCSVLPPLP